MPEAIPTPVRWQIVIRHQQGESFAQIAQELGLSYWGVRKVWRRYRDRGEEGLEPDYERCGRRGIRVERRLYRAALWLKRLHSRWGAGLVLAILKERWPEAHLPSERTVQRWWSEAGLNRRPTRRVTQQRARSSQPHEVWQIDAVEQVRLANGKRLCWLTIVDEYSGSLLAAEVFPPREDGSGTSCRRTGRLTALFSPLGVARTDTGG